MNQTGDYTKTLKFDIIKDKLFFKHIFFNKIKRIMISKKNRLFRNLYYTC